MSEFLDFLHNDWTEIPVGTRVQKLGRVDGELRTWFGIVIQFVEAEALGVKVEWAPGLTSWENASALFRASDVPRPSPPVVDGELPEPGIFVNLTTLKWWRELVDLNPADLAPRLDSQIKMALSKSPRSEGDK